MVQETKRSASDWRTVHGDSSDEEWAFIADLVPTFSGPGKIGRPAAHSKREHNRTGAGSPGEEEPSAPGTPKTKRAAR